MTIRDEILQSPYGTQVQLVRKAGFTRQTLYRLLYERAGSRRVAKAFARAHGDESRWPEFFEDPPALDHGSSLDPAV